MGKIITMPTAVLFGATHVSVAQCSSGWAAMAWTREAGPQMIGKPVSYGKAVERAKAYAGRVGAVLDLPIEMRRIDVQRCENGELIVVQISASESNATVLDTFGPHERDEAVAYALRMLPRYAPCHLGEAAETYAQQGCRTRLIHPLPDFKDWNAELQHNMKEAR